MNENWKLVYVHTNLFNVELIKAVLFDNEINAVIVNKKDQQYHFGDIELYVSIDDFTKAKNIITQNDL